MTLAIDPRVFAAACLLSCGIWVAIGLYQLFHSQAVLTKMREHHVPLAKFSLFMVIHAELGGAYLVGSGTHVTAGCIIWLAFILVATPVYHGRLFRDGAIDHTQLIQFFKNVSIAGGLLALILIDLSHR
jgi:putative oxidoreductase